jgi:molecular chaperone HtpG
MSQTESHTFQAEIQQVLDIVIHSLYTDREVFVRELVSNAADACEKLRFLQAGGTSAILQPEAAIGIQIRADKDAGTLTIADTGVGMTRDELVKNLGTIAHSGTKAFLKAVADGQKKDAGLIGQFGVGFYSAFMVAKKVTVLTQSHQPGEPAWRWTSEGAGGYVIEPASDLPRGTQIVLELKDDTREFSEKERVEGIVRRYSNFVSFPIEIDGSRLNTVQALWARNKAEVTEDEYREFYKFIGHDSETPLYRLHFTTDGPLSIQSLLFVPAQNLETLGLTRVESEVNLHCRKVLIEPKAKGLFPEWLRFLKGAVDCEDIPLNVSRERMQDSTLMKRLNRALTSKFLKFLAEESGKDAEAYDKFYVQYQRCLKEGILADNEHRDALAKLLRFESSTVDAGKRTSLAEYVSRMPEDQKEIYYVIAGSREAALSSPYYEVFAARKFEVLFLNESADEFVLDRVREFDGKAIVAAERAELEVPTQDPVEGQLNDEQAGLLAGWLKSTLGDSVDNVTTSKRLATSPALAVERDHYLTGTMRRTLKAMNRDRQDAPDVKPDFEFNPRHPLVARLEQIRHQDPDLAAKAAAQMYDNARMAAGLLEDPRPMLQRLNELLAQVLTPKA